jgi:protein SCO1/2
MPDKRKILKYTGLAGILFLFPLLWLILFGRFSSHHFGTCKYFGPDSLQGGIASNYYLPSFQLIDESGAPFSSDSLKGKIWLAAFYSIHDPNLPKITERLLNINFKYRDQKDIVIVSIETNPKPEEDEQRRNYVQNNTRYLKSRQKWKYLTGSQSAIDSLMHGAFFIQDLKKEALFRLIDPNGQIRGMYGNTEYHIDNAIEDIAVIRKHEIEEKKRKS